MRKKLGKIEFASLFKKYRLKSAIETLTEFGDILSGEGFMYENSLFTHWQKGDRVPKDRKLVLKMIEIFVRRGGIGTFEEANAFLASTNHRDLAEDEYLQFDEYFQPKNISTLPESIDLFVGRKQIIKNVTWELLNNKKVLLYGIPGVGKTALALHISHLLKDKYPDGVCWFRADVKTINGICDELLIYFGFSINFFKNNEEKIKKITEIIKNKKIILILDNIGEAELSHQSFRSLLSLPVPILMTAANNSIVYNKVKKFAIDSFTHDEFIQLAKIILGTPFIEVHKEIMKKLGQLLGYLPISSTIVLKQILVQPLKLDEYIAQIEGKKLTLRLANYDNKNLYSSLEFIYEKLDQETKNVLSSCSIFEGADFSLQAVAFIGDFSVSVAKNIMIELKKLSLVEKSVNNRYRLHPIVKLYLQDKLPTDHLYKKLTKFYHHKFHDRGKGDDIPFNQINKEVDNITGLIDICYKGKLYKEMVDLCECIYAYMWLVGKWKYIIQLAPKLDKAYKIINDLEGLAIFYIEHLGKIYFYNNNLQKTKLCLSKGKKIAKFLKNKNMFGLIIQKYGIILRESKNFNKAKKYLQESIKLIKGNIYKLYLIKSYLYLGNVYGQLKQYQKAIRYFKLALKMSEVNKIRDTESLANMYLGTVLLRIRKYKLSENYFKNAIKIDKKLRRKITLAISYYGIGIIKKYSNNYSEAVKYFKQSDNLCKDLNINNKKITVIYKSLFETI